ncbi:ATP-binding protein [Bdellovibrio bacteriovorus]|uniref:sensor histidine kinase n=2 Tax=Bdellovibrio TaxID=958 RepID=UPI0035A97894
MLCSTLAVRLWPYRHSLMHRLLLINQVAFILWTFWLLCIFAIPDFESRVLLTRLRPLVVAITPPNWVVMGLMVFYRDQWEKWKKWAVVIYIIPALTIFAAASSILNFSYAEHWVFYNFAEMPSGRGFLSYTFGPVIRVFFAFTLVCVSSLYIMYVHTAIKERGIKRRYAILFALGSSVHMSLEMYARYYVKDMLLMQLSVAYSWPMVMMFYFAVRRHEFLDIKTLAQERVFRNLPNPVITLTAQNELWDLNNAASKLLQLGPSDLGKPARQFPQLAKLTANSETVEYAGRIHQVFYHAIKVSGGEQTASVYVLNDVHPIMELNQDLEESNAILRELNSEILRMTEFNRRIQTVLSHDMTGALSSVNILLHGTREIAEERQETELATRLEKIQQASSGAVSLLRNILAWSSDEDHADNVDLEACLDAAWAQLTPQILQKEIQLRKNIVTSGLVVKSSRFMIEAIFRNLLSNAVRYSFPSSYVDVSLLSSGNEIEISISDSGRGMSLEVVNSILSRDSKKPMGSEGFGLGMHFTMGFVDKLHGKISISSSIGQGTTVKVLLPAT